MIISIMKSIYCHIYTVKCILIRVVWMESSLKKGEGGKYKRREVDKITIKISEKSEQIILLTIYQSYSMHNSEYKYAYIVNNEPFSSELTMLTLGAKNRLTKIPISDIRISLLSCWFGMSKRLPTHTVTPFYFVLVISQMWNVCPYCWRCHAFQRQGPETPELDLPKALHKLPNRKAINSPTQL